jgi:hypothetical protein
MNEENAGRVSEERAYLIRKGGAWYRPDSAGYTTNAHEAGLYTLEEAEKITHPNGPNGPRDAMSYHHRDTVPALALRAADHPAVVVRVKALEWKDLRGDGSRWAKDPYGGWIVATPNGWGNRDFPEQEKVSGGLASAMEAAETNHRLLILSCIEPLRPATEQAGGEVVAWRFRPRHEPGPWSLRHHQLADPAQVLDIEPLYASPPSPAATQSAVVSEALREALHFITNIDNAHPSVRKIRAALSNPGASQ